MRPALIMAAGAGYLFLGAQALAAGAPPTPPAGADASATVGALSIGEPVKDNTGATIGEIADLKADASGAQLAVIKMGSDQFQVSAEKLGASNGAAVINLTQAQIAAMLHAATGGPAMGATPGP